MATEMHSPFAVVFYGHDSLPAVTEGAREREIRLSLAPGSENTPPEVLHHLELLPSGVRKVGSSLMVMHSSWISLLAVGRMFIRLRYLCSLIAGLLRDDCKRCIGLSGYH